MMTATATLRRILYRLGLLEMAWRVRERLVVLNGRGAMKFPPFPSDIQHAAIGSGDYARYASLALAIRRTEDESIEGAFAEVGVYQGATSRFILRCAAGRTLYLFDTFEGFPAEDLEAGHPADSRFRDTSEQGVRRMLGEPSNVVIRKGRFPETAAGLERERFALVSLDLDVFAPTLAGLEFFYPRLSRGGYLFVHDFNSPESNSACRRAVTQFMADKPERIVELPDMRGSIVLRKS
jgi:O-methyltransferase